MEAMALIEIDGLPILTMVLIFHGKLFVDGIYHGPTTELSQLEIPVDFSELRLILVFESFDHPGATWVRPMPGRRLGGKKPTFLRNAGFLAPMRWLSFWTAWKNECKWLIVIADHSHGSEPALCAHWGSFVHVWICCWWLLFLWCRS